MQVLLAGPCGLHTPAPHPPPPPGVLQAARPAVQQLARDLAMHVAGMRSHYLSRDAAPADVVQRERALLQEQAAASGKPAAVIDKVGAAEGAGPGAGAGDCWRLGTVHA
jgi:hypothetical protein